MENNFYSYLFNQNRQSKQAEDSQPQTMTDDSLRSTVVQDESIGKPWTHRYTIYCADPQNGFLEDLKKNGCVLAVYEKVKETSEPSSDKEAAPTNG